MYKKDHVVHLLQKIKQTLECYNEILDFFRRCIIKQLKDFRLAQTLDVYLSD